MLADATPPPSTTIGMLGSGTPDPLGATWSPDGLNVSVYAKRATGVDLLLFDDAEHRTPGRVLALSPATNRTGAYWHAFVGGIAPGQLYGYRISGPSIPGRGLRFDPSRVLLDPYGTGVAIPDGYRPATHGGAPGDPVPMKSVVTNPAAYDWEGDRPLGRSVRDTVIYEAHVAGFTASPSSGVAADRRGTYAGFIEKIPYLVDLGVTAVELRRCSPLTRTRRRRASSTTGDTSRSRSSRPTRRTRRTGRDRARSTSSATSSRRSTAPASR